jgi:transcriptional regulator with XRE-family HTH domain
MMSSLAGLETVDEALQALGARARALRLLRELSQEELAGRAGVGVATVQRFENSGRASLENVYRLAQALRAEGVLHTLFAAPPYTSIDEALARPAKLAARRVRRRR